ncbi:hypothetical protein SFRURICE_013815 [Spodoptera frugiperda]|uniref:SFRICE_025116 n=1 Tax=Spodoptera frugiperda TaxID=7108 RepID=A0A2H1VMT6_SPOFR|nr:hypothetical protein SFRURICE_013815 [Spodoptera frugiperda]
MWQFEDSEIYSIGMIHPSNSRHSGLSMLSGVSQFSEASETGHKRNAIGRTATVEENRTIYRLNKALKPAMLIT